MFMVEEAKGPIEAMPQADLNIDLVDQAFVIGKPLHPLRQRALSTNTPIQVHELML